MFCRNCGREIAEGSTVCTGCGVPAGSGYKFCPRCGHPTDELAVFCTNCGAPLTNAQGQTAAGAPGKSGPGAPKSKIAAGLLGIFLGGLGIHNFYLGYNEKGIWQVVLFVLCCGTVSSIWGFVEGLMILTGKINTDASGQPLAD